MTQLTVRGFDEDLERRLREIARRQGISLNRAALLLLRKGAGLDEPSGRANVVGDSLDHLAGTWSEAEAQEFQRAVGFFEEVDRELWQ